MAYAGALPAGCAVKVAGFLAVCCVGLGAGGCVLAPFPDRGDAPSADVVHVDANGADGAPADATFDETSPDARPLDADLADAAVDAPRDVATPDVVDVTTCTHAPTPCLDAQRSCIDPCHVTFNSCRNTCQFTTCPMVDAVACMACVNRCTDDQTTCQQPCLNDCTACSAAAVCTGRADCAAMLF